MKWIRRNIFLATGKKRRLVTLCLLPFGVIVLRYKPSKSAFRRDSLASLAKTSIRMEKENWVFAIIWGSMTLTGFFTLNPIGIWSLGGTLVFSAAIVHQRYNRIRITNLLEAIEKRERLIGTKLTQEWIALPTSLRVSDSRAPERMEGAIQQLENLGRMVFAASQPTPALEDEIQEFVAENPTDQIGQLLLAETRYAKILRSRY